MIDETFYAYLAGLIDGEGSIGIYKCKQTKKANVGHTYFYTIY
jgi:hypothetical protein